MRIAILCFTDQGEKMAHFLADRCGGEVLRCGKKLSLHESIKQAFDSVEALIFVGATGIAVRAIAPFIAHKTKDPAVVVVDEKGQYVISLLSGHLGGANDLATTLAKQCDLTPVITTATDVNGIFAVDAWAKHQHCHLVNPEQIKVVSSKLLHGESVNIQSPWEIQGKPPQNVMLASDGTCDVVLTLAETQTTALQLIPRVAVLGVGCRKGTSTIALQQAFALLLQQTNLSPYAIKQVCSIDLKKEELGLIQFCEALNLPLETYCAAQLNEVDGAFTASNFVSHITGVDNVCERSAVLGSGGKLYCSKQTYQGITMALALSPIQLDWSWKNE